MLSKRNAVREDLTLDIHLTLDTLGIGMNSQFFTLA
jgi:hypothetical protein